MDGAVVIFTIYMPYLIFLQVNLCKELEILQKGKKFIASPLNSPRNKKDTHLESSAILFDIIKKALPYLKDSL